MPHLGHPSWHSPCYATVTSQRFTGEGELSVCQSDEAFLFSSLTFSGRRATDTFETHTLFGCTGKGGFRACVCGAHLQYLLGSRSSGTTKKFDIAACPGENGRFVIQYVGHTLLQYN